MRPNLHGPALGALLFVLAAGARAQDRPQTTPTRDVDITYRVTRAGQTLQERTRWLAAEEKERVEPPGAEESYVLIDRRAHLMEVVNTQSRTVLDMPTPTADPLSPGPQARFTRIGEDTVAGLGCTEWQSAVGTLPRTSLCLTADGVLLRLRSGTSTLAEAIAVQYAPADDAAFRIPADYHHESAPGPEPR